MPDYEKTLDVIVLPKIESPGRFLIVGLDKAFSLFWSGDDLGRTGFEYAVEKAHEYGPVIERSLTENRGRVRGSGLKTRKPWVYYSSLYEHRKILYQESNSSAIVDMTVFSHFDQRTNSYAVFTLLQLEPRGSLGHITLMSDNYATIEDLASKLNLPERL